MAAAPLVVVGAGLAAWTTVREFRKLAPHAPVVVVTADSGDFYAKPSLSNAFSQKRVPAQLVTTPAATMAQTLQVRLLAHTEVTALDTASQTLQMRTADNPSALQTLAYGQLVLATGAQAIRAPLTGNAAQEVLSVNSLADFSRLHAQLVAGGTAKTVLIIGAGLIGSEFANDLAGAGHTVHVVDPSRRPLQALLPPAASGQLQQALQALGVHWHLGATVQSVERRGGPHLHCSLSNGVALEVDVVLSAIGLRANTTLAQAAGLQCDRGVVVDAMLQTSAPQVYALGDVAQYASAGSRSLPYVMPIMQAAKALAQTLHGTPTPLVFPLMPVAVKTPAYPLVVSPPAPGLAADWQEDDAQESAGMWLAKDSSGTLRGFVLGGAQTAKRMEMTRQTVL